MTTVVSEPEQTTEPELPPLDSPRRLRSHTLDDRLSLYGSGAGSLGLTWLVYERILPVFGLVGFLVLWYVVFLAMYAAVTAVGNPRPVVADRIASSVVAGGALVVVAALASTVIFTVIRGAPALPHLNFYTQDMSGVAPLDALDHGGILHAVAGSLIELGIATIIALPLGIATAVYMTEVGGGFARIVRTVIEAMTALPDILAGLFVYYLVVITLGSDKDGFAAGLALSITMLPIIARAADVVLRVVPGGLREAGLALGASHWQTVWRVVLPTARPGLATALILGVARAIGETAPVLLASGASQYLNGDPFHQNMNSLPLYIFTAVRSGQPTYIARGFGAAVVLLALVLLLFAITRRLARTKVRGR
jgi:phosphate transport system permease protein